MSRPSGLGRGLASLIPQRKKNDSVIKEQNYFGTSVSEDLEVSLPSARKATTPVVRNPGSDIKNIKTKDGSAGIGDISLRSVIDIPVESIASNPYQPRKIFNEEKLQELAESIKVHGIIQPLVVTRKNDGRYELIAGERRLEASKIAGFKKVPVITKTVSDQDKLELALIENIQRYNLNVIEEARSYRQLQEIFGLTQEEIAARVGKSRSAVTNTLRLLNLPIEIQKSLQQGQISEGHARTILAIANPEKQRALFEMILKENLSVRQLEEKVRQVTIATHQRRMKSQDPEIQDMEQQLSSSLGTKVKIKKNSKGGQIAIEYFSIDEFNNLFNKLSKIE